MDATRMRWSFPKKIKSRADTIIKPWSENFGRIVPACMGYWTICGRCYNDDGGILKGCEPDQLIGKGFISSEQYHGVDVDTGVIAGNRKAWPSLDWINSDFRVALRSATQRPAIVNCDTTFQPRKAVRMLADVMTILDKSTGPLMLVTNVVVAYMNARKGMDIPESLRDNDKFMASWTSGRWRPWVDSMYEYVGNNNATTMGSIVLLRNE